MWDGVFAVCPTKDNERFSVRAWVFQLHVSPTFRLFFFFFFASNVSKRTLLAFIQMSKTRFVVVENCAPLRGTRLLFKVLDSYKSWRKNYF